jgi:DNA polymerase III subunit epsilon
MMREIVIDTETTGLDPAGGHRVIELGCVELWNGISSGLTWHSYFNPERSVPQEAIAIHGLTEQALAAAPLFKDKAAEFLDFIAHDRLIAHNAPFDSAFLNAELKRAGHSLLGASKWLDTMDLARVKLPGKARTLDALCDHFGVSRAARGKHGALKDARLLAEVYALLSGRAQLTLDFGAPQAPAGLSSAVLKRLKQLPGRLSEAEKDAHARFLGELGAPPLWDLKQAGSNGRVALKTRSGRGR